MASGGGESRASRDKAERCADIQPSNQVESSTQIRRTNPASEKPPRSSCRFLIDSEGHSVLIGDRSVCLTRTEFRLLEHLISRRGRWVHSLELIQDVLGTHHRRDTPLVRVHVHALRRKLGEEATWLESDPRRVRGYRWSGPPPAHPSGPADDVAPCSSDPESRL